MFADCVGLAAKGQWQPQQLPPDIPRPPVRVRARLPAQHHILAPTAGPMSSSRSNSYLASRPPKPATISIEQPPDNSEYRQAGLHFQPCPAPLLHPADIRVHAILRPATREAQAHAGRPIAVSTAARVLLANRQVEAFCRVPFAGN